MSSARQTNPVAVTIVFGLVAIVAWIVGSAMNDHAKAAPAATDLSGNSGLDAPIALDKQLASSAERPVEADSTVDTLRSLTAQLRLEQEKVEALQKEKRERDDEIQKQRIVYDKKARKEQERTKQISGEINRKFDQVSRELTQFKSRFENEVIKGTVDETAMMRRLGIVDGEQPRGVTTVDGRSIPTLRQPDQVDEKGSGNVSLPSDSVVWIEPMDGSKTIDREGNATWEFPDVAIGRVANGVDSVAGGTAPKLALITGKEQGETHLKPYRTLPVGASLLEGKTLTAMIGRIPIQGAVTDPFQFKMLVGAENLASNGIRIPDLKGIVASGMATGDYTLKCTKGTITALTFTFSDGRISTFTVDDTVDGSDSLGYVTDAYGVPCISGQYITNAAEYLSQSGILAGLKAGAEGYSEAQTTTYADSDSSSRAVTGSAGSYAAGQAGSAMLDTGIDFLSARQQSAFDAIFVANNQSLDLHITTEVHIDYDDNGRRVAHETVNHRVNDLSGNLY